MKKSILILTVLIMCLSLFSCGGDKESSKETPTETKATKPLDLTGKWVHTDTKAHIQEAIISDGTITINWTVDDAGMDFIYWAGTYIAPEKATDKYSWTSEKDAEKTEGSMMASSDETKEFTYDKGILSYKVTVSGTTKTLKLKKSEDNSDIKSETEKKDSSGKVKKINLDNKDGTLTYVKHKVTTDFDGNPALEVFFSYKNKKEDADSAQGTFYPQIFQNGVECDTTIADENDKEMSNASKDVQKGTTIDIAFLYELQDSKSPVTIKVSDQSSENLLDDVYQEQEITLK